MYFLKSLKLNKKKRALLLSVVLLVFVGVLGAADYVHADWYDDFIAGKIDILKKLILLVIGGILQFVVLVVGQVMVLVVTTIISISSYNSFISEPSIVMAWAIIRDFCNMFFILILLVIAFATILRIESYNMKKWLPKLLIMAVLINFSRTIAGLIIDFSQVFMLTFVSAVGTTGGAIINAVGVQSYFTTVAKENINIFAATNLDLSSTLMGLFMGTAFLIIATIVLAVFLVILVMRMVMLWVYVVLSPLAFLLEAFPGGKSYASRWWSEFVKNVITGPILMFFFWLALITAGSFKDSDLGKISSTCFGPAEAVCPSNFLHFVIAIGMLMGGLIITSQAGGAGSSLAGKGKDMISRGAKGFTGRVTGYDYAKRTGQGYMAMRKSQRDERIRLSSEKLAQNIGRAKETVAKPLNLVGGGIKNVTWNRWTGKRKADDLRKEVKEEELKLAIAQEKIKNKSKGAKFTDHNGTEYTRLNANAWEDHTGGIVSNEFVEKEAVKHYDKSISDKRKEIKKQDDRHESWNKMARRGLGISGAVLGGVVTGGAGLIALGAGATGGYLAGSKGLPKLTGSIGDAGSDDMSLASNFRLKQINSEQEGMKSQDLDSVKATMDDSTKDMFARVAAIMEVIARGKMDSKEAKERVDFIRDNMGGTDKKGDWKDKKLGFKVDSLLEQNNLGVTKRWDMAYSEIPAIAKKYGLSTADATSAQEKARMEIGDGFASGTYSMEKMDTSSLVTSLNQLVMSMKTGNFVKQFKALTSETKKSQVIERLKEIDSPESRIKLAHLTDIDTAFDRSGDITGKMDFIKGLGPKDLLEIMDDSDTKKLEAIKKAVSKRTDLHIEIQNRIEADTPAGKTFAKAFNV